jgi:FtsH-binding integral membrane protein
MSTSPIDARGPQFNAALTSVVLVLALLTSRSPAGVVLLGLQGVLFLVAVVAGVQRTPAAWLFRRVVRPRIGPATRWEDPRPPRFAQGIGLVFALAGLAGFVLGPTWLGYAATGVALVAALLNATVQVCLGCRIYGICHLPQNTYPLHELPTARQSTTDTKEVAA